MSYSWNIGSGKRSGSSSKDAYLGSAAVATPLTPPSVRNVTPATCLSMLQFRGEHLSI